MPEPLTQNATTPNGSDITRGSACAAGGTAGGISCTRAGFLPVPLASVPVHAFDGLAVYLRSVSPGDQKDNREAFSLYRAADLAFTMEDRQRLASNGVRLLYIRIADQHRLQKQIEHELLNIIKDPSVASVEAATIVYETSVALMDELLNDPEMVLQSSRLTDVSRAVTAMIIQDPKSFSHLFHVSHHDFYTATHLVNVATWMVPLAYSIGYRNPDDLLQVCQAGLLHDIGKIKISADLLNKKDTLTGDDWGTLRQHPLHSFQYIERMDNVSDLVRRIVVEHHERLDGSGYPFGLKDLDIHPFSRLCAVVDSFDAMTAFRPFKEKTLQPAEAIRILQEEAPSKYDEEIVDAWLSLMKSSQPDLAIESVLSVSTGDAKVKTTRRKDYRFHCSGRAHLLVETAGGWTEQEAIQITLHNISTSGVGFLSPVEIPQDQRVRLYLQLRGWGNKKYVEGHTVRCRRYPDGWYEVGVQLSSPAKSTEEVTRCPVVRGRKNPNARIFQ